MNWYSEGHLSLLPLRLRDLYLFYVLYVSSRLSNLRNIHRRPVRWHFGGVLQGGVIENKSRPKERALNVKTRSSLQTLVCVDNTSVLLVADAVQWLQ